MEHQERPPDPMVVARGDAFRLVRITGAGARLADALCVAAEHEAPNHVHRLAMAAAETASAAHTWAARCEDNLDQIDDGHTQATTARMHGEQSDEAWTALHVAAATRPAPTNYEVVNSAYRAGLHDGREEAREEAMLEADPMLREVSERVNIVDREAWEMGVEAGRKGALEALGLGRTTDIAAARAQITAWIEEANAAAERYAQGVADGRADQPVAPPGTMGYDDGVQAGWNTALGAIRGGARDGGADSPPDLAEALRAYVAAVAPGHDDAYGKGYIKGFDAGTDRNENCDEYARQEGHAAGMRHALTMLGWGNLEIGDAVSAKSKLVIDAAFAHNRPLASDDHAVRFRDGEAAGIRAALLRLGFAGTLDEAVVAAQELRARDPNADPIFSQLPADRPLLQILVEIGASAHLGALEGYHGRIDRANAIREAVGAVEAIWRRDVAAARDMGAASNYGPDKQQEVRANG